MARGGIRGLSRAGGASAGGASGDRAMTTGSRTLRAAAARRGAALRATWPALCRLEEQAPAAAAGRVLPADHCRAKWRAPAAYSLHPFLRVSDSSAEFSESSGGKKRHIRGARIRSGGYQFHINDIIAVMIRLIALIGRANRASDKAACDAFACSRLRPPPSGRSASINWVLFQK